MDGSRQPGDSSRRQQSLLDRYRAIALTSRAMVAAARAEDWERVHALERECLQQVLQLKRAAQVQSLSAADQATRVHLLRNVLADDAEIRRLAEPWLAQLEHLLLPPLRERARGAKRGGT